MSNNDIIDNEIFAELSDLMGDEVHELYDEFRKQTPDIMQKLEQAVATSELGTIHELSHLIKSSSSNLGIWRLASACNDLESKAVSGCNDNIEELFAQMQSEFNAFLAHNFDIAC
jgi:HPt (histidine-containing phosphotransfer) domain-containing protein